MSIDRLDNEYGSFLKAQEWWGQGDEVVMEVTSKAPLSRYIDSKMLQKRLDEIVKVKLGVAQRQYLALTKRFTNPFLDYLQMGLSPAKVLSKGEDLKVRVTGTLSDVAQWEVPISIQLHDLYNAGVFQENGLFADVVVTEAVRRFQTKVDLLRNSKVRFVEAGCRYRYGADWYIRLIQVMMGDVPDLLLGTTNLAMAMVGGLAPIAYADILTLDSPYARVSPTSVRELGELVARPDLSDRTLVVSGVNAYEMAHLHSHFGDRLVFEWDVDLTSDMGLAGKALPLAFTTT